MSFIFLPPTIALNSSQFNFYLNYSSDSDSETYGNLKFRGENVFSRLAKFEVLASNTGTGLVHIRSAHNKKFLRRVRSTFYWLSPDADEPEEDQSAWSCTLFEPQVAVEGNPNKVHLFHVESRQYATPWDLGGGPDRKIFALLRQNDSQNILDVIDVESLVILPRHVALRGHTDNYCMLDQANAQELRFSSTDKGNPLSWFEVFTDGHGRVQIQSSRARGYWHQSGGTIYSDPRVLATNAATFFSAVKVDSNTVALKSLINHIFCSQASGTNLLTAPLTQTSIAANSRFRVEELVLSRRIYNMDFDFAGAIIYGETPVTMATANTSNNTSAENTVEFKFSHTESQSNTWTSSHSWMVGIEVQISAKIPFGLGGIQNTYSAEYNGSIEWGETITTETTLETTYTATVPANTSISVSLMATKGYCDVPYSYYQRDVLYDGRTVVYKKDDGMYTGISSYNFRYEVATLREPESRADLSTIEQKLPIPLVDPSIQQKLPLPLPFGSTKVQTRVSSTSTSTSTTTPEQKLSSLQLEDAANSAMHETLA